MRKVYLTDTVDVAARKRIAWIFDEFERVTVSVSGGKDSTVLCWLALQEAHKRGRKIGVFFLDEETVYMSTVHQVRYLMELCPENTEKMWVQFPFRLTNATSFRDSQLLCWDAEREADWMRRKEPDSIQAPPWDVSRQYVKNKVKGFGFYDVLENFDRIAPDTAHLVGLRADESLDRFRAVTRNPGYKDCAWSTAVHADGSVRFYPLYDWTFDDIWTFIADNNIRYSPIYDYMYQKGMARQEIRVSSLIHEKSFKSLVELPEFEPETFDKLMKRIGGAQTGNLYGKDDTVFRARKLPKNFASWAEYRDFLLETYPDADKKRIFAARFAGQGDGEAIARQQCRQLTLGDYENNIPVKRKSALSATVTKWRGLL